MSGELILPDKYHIVWLDSHIGDPNFCIQLKRAFYTNIAANSEEVVSLSEKDINSAIVSESEICLKFENFHFTLRSFTKVQPCLDYIDTIKADRVVVITSSTLGQEAVPKILDRYPETFKNRITQEPIISIYIFCLDVAKAASWAADYYEYIMIFDFEGDLLARITRDLGDEFIDQGERLMQANKLAAAEERLSWAKSLHIRHEKYAYRTEPQPKATASVSDNKF